jgi:hypothetical protein
MEIIFVLVIIGVVALIIAKIIKNAKMTPEQRQKEKDDLAQKQRNEQASLERQKRIETYGLMSPEMICPHCQTKGQISTKPVKRKKGVSGAKVTGALLTLGVSVLATGLSRKEGLTQAHCGNCNSTWDF